MTPEDARAYWRSLDRGDNWLDFVDIVHRRPSGVLRMACGLEQGLQRRQLKGRQFRRKKWERTDALTSCLGCLAEAA